MSHDCPHMPVVQKMVAYRSKIQSKTSNILCNSTKNHTNSILWIYIWQEIPNSMQDYGKLVLHTRWSCTKPLERLACKANGKPPRLCLLKQASAHLPHTQSLFPFRILLEREIGPCNISLPSRSQNGNRDWVWGAVHLSCSPHGIVTSFPSFSPVLEYWQNYFVIQGLKWNSPLSRTPTIYCFSIQHLTHQHTTHHSRWCKPHRRQHSC